MRFLMSTFTHLLMVKLFWTSNKFCVTFDVIEGGLGIYFGLTRTSDMVYAVSRNKDVLGYRQQKDRPQNAILEIPLNSKDFEISRRWTLPEFDDLHQIRVFGNYIAVLTGHSPELLFVDRYTREIAAKFSLSDLVPDFLRHTAPEDRPNDIYHFNSLTFYKDRLFVLAHNWTYGSFIIQVKLEFSTGIPSGLILERVFSKMGVGSHDVVLDDNRFFVCDGVNNNLLIMDLKANTLTTLKIAPVEGTEYYPRGLGVDNSFILVGSGVSSKDKRNRASTSTRLNIIDKKTTDAIADVEIGSWGNSCDILLIDRKDLSDQ